MTTPQPVVRSDALKDAVELARQGKKAEARQLFGVICAAEPNNEKAWLWRASLADTRENALEWLSHVLRINPGNATAIAWMAKLRPPEPKPEPEPRVVCPFCPHTAAEDFVRCPSCNSVVYCDLQEIARNDGAGEKQLRRCIQHYRTLLQVREDFSLHYYIAVAHLNLFESSLAMRHLECALALNPEAEDVRQSLETLKQRRLVLIVDDCATVRLMVGQALERNGYRTMPVETGIDVLTLVPKLRPDLILLDINMPLMDGYQVCKRVKSMPEGKKLPVIMLSGNDVFVDKIKGKMAGATDYLTKPFNATAVLKAIRKQLER